MSIALPTFVTFVPYLMPDAVHVRMCEHSHRTPVAQWAGLKHDACQRSAASTYASVISVLIKDY